ncbi:trypsin-like serine peptidase [Kitasatospora sp. NPDC004615]|uniref:trypsin-like serine peptidase n=1 Tax=unclassified Kitasatospora TaxID=2633591 RepID=UPI0036CB5174
MTDQHRVKRRIRNASAAALVTVLAVTTAACQSDKPKASPAPAGQSSGASNKDSVDIGDVQNFLSQVPNWSADDWKKWAAKNGFKPEDIAKIKDFWDKKKPSDPTKSTEITPDAPSIKDLTLPTPVKAKAQPHPYSADTAVIGKVFFQAPDGPMVCSGTVVSDPAHPGKSNLVWTAGHCVHDGKGGDFFTNWMFAPGYNRSGVTSNGKKPEITWAQAAPMGRWLATDMLIMPQWAKEGTKVGTAAMQFDFAVVRVAALDGSDRSLEETVGSSVPIWFGAKPDEITSPSGYGYPGAAPYNGEELEHCDAPKLSPFVFDRSRPPMLAMGCTMTGGSSGGGWLTRQNGKTMLFSNVSIGDHVNDWQAGPTLGPEAKKMFDAFVAKK